MDFGNMMNPTAAGGVVDATSTDLTPMLWKRLEEKKSERMAAQTKIQRLNTQHTKLLNSVSTKNRRRDTLEMIDNQIKSLERRRTTTSLKLAEEKKILREMESLERLKKQEIEMANLRDELNTQRDILRETNSAIGELENALAKVNLADRLGCSTDDLTERIMDCPRDKMAQVIGKAGSTISQIEKSTGVQMEVSDSDGGADGKKTGGTGTGRIRLVGSIEAINRAVLEIENITKAIEDSFTISKALVVFFLSKRGAVLNKARKSYPNVRVDLTNDTLTLRGKPDEVAIAKNDFLSYNVKKVGITITSRQIGLIVGKGGSNIKKIEEDYDVAVDVPNTTDGGGSGGSGGGSGSGGGRSDRNKSGNRSSTATSSSAGSTSTSTMTDQKLEVYLVGLSANVDRAHDYLTDLIHENEDIEEVLLVPAEQRNMFLENSGAVLKEIQNEIGMCRLYFERREDSSDDKYDDIGGGGGGGGGGYNKMSTNLTIRARRCDLVRAKELVLARMNAFRDTMVSIQVDPNIIPAIIGKGGATIKSLQSSSGGEGGNSSKVSIDIDKESSSITIQSESKELRDEVQRKIEEIIANNQELDVPIEKNIIGLFFGEPGKEMKSKVTEEFGVTMNLSSDDMHIVLRGSVDQINSAATVVREFLSANYTEEIPIEIDDESYMYQGGPKNILNKLQEEYGVNATFLRSKHFVSIRGKRDDVLAAKDALLTSLYGGNGMIVYKVPVPSSSRGIVVGKEGSQLKKFESDHPGVSATLLRNNGMLILRGPLDEAKKCRSAVYVLLATASLTERITINPEEYIELNKPGLMKDLVDTYGVNVQLESSLVKIRGVPADVSEAVARVKEITTGKYTALIALDVTQVDKIQKALEESQHFMRISESTKTSVSLDTDLGCIKLCGKRNAVKKAKFLLLKFLDFMLPNQFAKVTIPKQAIRTIGNAASLAEVAADTGATLWLDRDLSCVHIRSSNATCTTSAVDGLKHKLTENDARSHTMELDPRDKTWLLPRIIGKGGTSINEIRKASGCNIHIARDDASITLSGEDDAVAKARQLLEGIINKGKAGSAYVDLPEGSMTLFIGKGGSNVRAFEKAHGVTVDRMQGGSGGDNRPQIRLQVKETSPSGGGGGGGEGGDDAGQEEDEEKEQVVDVVVDSMETRLANAIKAVELWVKEYEDKNAIKSIPIQEYMVPALVGKKGSVIMALEKETGCKINIRDGIVNLMGEEQSRLAAEARVMVIVAEEQRKYDARMIERERMVQQQAQEREASRAASSSSSAAAASASSSGPTTDVSGGGGGGDMTQDNASSPSEPPKSNIPSIPVGMSASAYKSVYGGPTSSSHQASSNKSKKSHQTKDLRSVSAYAEPVPSYKPNPYVTEAGTDLLKFLSSNDPEIIADMMNKLHLTLPQEQRWDSLSAVVTSSSTTSSDDAITDGDVADATTTGSGGGYYRSSSGFVVRV